MRHFNFWISLSLRPKTETKLLSFGLSPNLAKNWSKKWSDPMYVLKLLLKFSVLSSLSVFFYFNTYIMESDFVLWGGKNKRSL